MGEHEGEQLGLSPRSINWGDPGGGPEAEPGQCPPRAEPAQCPKGDGAAKPR